MRQSRPGRVRSRAVVVAVVVAAVLALHAVPSTAIDLLRSYELSLVNDGQLKVGRARAEQGREALPQARAQLWPNISFNYAYGQTDQTRSFNDISESQRYASRNGILQLRQPIYRRNLLAQVDEARSRVANTDALFDKDFQSLGVRVVGAYFDALFAHDGLALIEVQRGTYEAQLRAAKLALSSGTGTRTDIDDIQARYDLLLADEIKTRQAIDNGIKQLEIYVGEPIRSLSTLNAEVFRAEDHDPGNVDPWIERAMAYSPDVRALKAKLDSATASVEIARSGHYPSLDLVAQSSDSKGDATQTIPKSENRVNYVGVQLAVPIFSGGYVSSQVRQALAAEDEAREAYDFAKDDLRLQVRKEYDTIKASISRVRALEIALASGDQMVLSNQKGVQAGTRTMLDVLTAEQQRFNTRVELARARYQILVSWANLQSYVGELNQERIAQMNRMLRKDS